MQQHARNIPRDLLLTISIPSLLIVNKMNRASRFYACLNSRRLQGLAQPESQGLTRIEVTEIMQQRNLI